MARFLHREVTPTEGPDESRVVQDFEDQGFVFLSSLLPLIEMEELGAELHALKRRRVAGWMPEDDSDLLRKIFGVHFTSKPFGRLAHSPRIVRLARAILGDEVYLFRAKVNAKSARVGDGFGWHQDYPHWRDPGGLPRCEALGVVVYLDRVTFENGPIEILAKSHHEKPYWNGLTRHLVDDLKRRYEVVVPTGPAGSVLILHGRTVHGSAANRSNNDRAVAVLTYSAARNRPTEAVNVPRYLADPTAPVIRLETDS